MLIWYIRMWAAADVRVFESICSIGSCKENCPARKYETDGKGFFTALGPTRRV